MDNVVSAPLLDMDFPGTVGPSDPMLTTTESDPFSARVGLVSFRGAFSVASSNRLVQAIGPDVRDHEIVILDFSPTTYVDDSAALLMEQVISTAEDEGTSCIVLGLAEPVSSTLHSLNVFRRVPGNPFRQQHERGPRPVQRVVGPARRPAGGLEANSKRLPPRGRMASMD